MASSAEDIAAFERIATRIALTTDDKLEELLGKLLCPILNKLSTMDVNVRAKVLEVLKLINTRVKPVPSIKLPLVDLIKCFHTAGSEAAVVRNMSLVYTRMALARCSNEDGVTAGLAEQQSVAHRALQQAGLLLRNAAQLPAQQQVVVLQLAMDGLSSLHKEVPRQLEDPAELRATFPMLEREADKAVFLSHALKVMLYVPGYSMQSREQASPLTGLPPSNLVPLMNSQNPAIGAAAQASHAAIAQRALSAHAQANPDAAAAAAAAPPGLSLNDLHQVMGHAEDTVEVKQSRVTHYKLALLKLFARSSDLAAQDIVLHLLAAACDSKEEVIREADTLLRKKCGLDSAKPVLEVEQASLVRQAFTLVLGSPELMKADPQAPPEVVRTWRQPCSHSLQIRLLRICCKSVTAANLMPLTLQVIIAGLRGKGATLRTQQAVMEFAVWVFRQADDTRMKAMAPLAVRGVLGKLESMDPTNNSPQALSLRSFLYQAVGQLAQRAPELFRDRLEIPQKFVAALSTEPAGIRTTVLESVNSLATAYKNVKASLRDELQDMLSQQIRSQSDGVRLCAVNWACTVFAPTDPFARHLCLMTVSDPKQEVREASLKGLGLTASGEARAVDRFDEATASASQRPPFADMLHTLRTQHPVLTREPTSAAPSVSSDLLLSALRFLQTCPLDSSPNEASTETMQTDHDDVQEAACQDKWSEGYRRLLDHCLVRDASTALQIAALKAIMELAAEDRARFASSYSGRTAWLLAFLAHLDVTVRTLAARVLAVSATGLAAAECAQLLSVIVSKVEPLNGGGKDAAGVPPKFEEAHGSILATGLVGAACMFCSGKANGDAAPVSSAVERAAAALVRTLHHGNADYAAAAAAALGHLSLGGELLIPVGEVPEDVGVLPNSEASKAKGDDSAEPLPTDHASVCVKLAALCKDNRLISQPRLKLQVISGIGCLGWAASSADVRRCLVHILLSQTPTSGSEDLHFTVGEALALAFGTHYVTRERVLFSDFTSLAEERTRIDKSEASGAQLSDEAAPSSEATPSAGGDESVQELVISTVFSKVHSSNGSVRCAAAVWLVSLLMFCGRSTHVQAKLIRAQEALAALLGDSNELTQEVASKGLTAVYEAGDEETRERLVDALVGTLQGGTAAATKAVKVDADSEVFEDGALGKAPGGASLSTYKEICSLATDMGQPDLVYKFMDLANQTAALKSKRGAAFGFASIAKLSLDRVKPHIPVLLPKLYRYSYDPNMQVQEAMGHILTALVPSRAAALDEHFDAVIADLLRELGSRLWRNRQASCLALADLLQGRRWPQVKPNFERIWEMTLRVVDDIKDSVRTHGERLFRVVKNLTCRFADAEHTSAKESAEALSIALPVLVEKGMLSRVPYVKAQSIQTLSAIIDVAAPSNVSPQLPALISALLESLSGLEASDLNVVQMHVERLGLDGSELEAKRVKLSQQTAMHSALERAARLVNADSVGEVAAALANLVRRGVGLNTRTGTARFITSLTMHVPPAILQKPAGDLLKALLSTVKTEHSAVIRKAYAGAIGSLTKVASGKRVAWLVEQVLQMYTSSGDTTSRLTAGQVLQEVSRLAAGKLADVGDMVLPVAFRARWDVSPEVRTVWEEVFTDLGVSESAAFVRSGEDVVSAIVGDLRAEEFAARAAAASAAKGLAETCSTPLQQYAPEIMQALLGMLPGRLWSGKEELLRAVAALAKACTSAFTSGTSKVAPKQVVEGLVSATTRNLGDTYTSVAAESLVTSLKEFKSESHAAAMGPVLEMADKLLQDTDAMETDDAEDDQKKENGVSLPQAMDIIGSACTPQAVQDSDFISRVHQLLTRCLERHHHWNARLAAIRCVEAMLAATVDSGTNRAVKTAADQLTPCMLESGHDKVQQVRLACLRVVEFLSTHSESFQMSEACASAVKAFLAEASSRERDEGLRVRAQKLQLAFEG